MKYKENKLAFYGLIFFFALAGWFITSHVVSLNTYMWPILQIGILILISKFGVKIFTENKPFSAMALLWMFVSIADLAKLIPAPILLSLQLIHLYIINLSFMDISAEFTINLLFQLIPIYFISLIYFLRRPIALFSNVLLSKKTSVISVENIEQVLTSIPADTDTKTHDVVLRGSISLVKATETVILQAKSLDKLQNFVFVLKDRKNSIFLFKNNKYFVDNTHAFLSDDGNLLSIEVFYKPNVFSSLIFKKKAESFVYYFNLEDIHHTILNKIHQLLRFEVKTNYEIESTSTSSVNGVDNMTISNLLPVADIPSDISLETDTSTSKELDSNHTQSNTRSD